MNLPSRPGTALSRRVRPGPGQVLGIHAKNSVVNDDISVTTRSAALVLCGKRF
jgi:hypothetical protein